MPSRDRPAEGQQRGGERGLHSGSPEEAAEKAAPLLSAVLVGDSVNPAVHMQLAAVQGQLADVQIFPCDHQRPGGCGHDDAGLVKTLHILHTGDG